MMILSDRFFTTQHAVRIALAVCAAVFAPACHHARPPLNPNVTQPALATEALAAYEPKSLYFTFAAHDYLAAHQPEWIAAHKSDQDLHDFALAEQDPQFWRKLDRKYRFDALLLCGDPTEWHNLLEHLIISKDWTLVYLDHTSMIFRRAPAKPWEIGDFHALEQKFANYPDYDRAGFLTLVAGKLLVIGQANLAKPQIDEAIRLDKDSPAAWTQLALYNLQSNLAADAVKAADHALSLDKDDFDALSAKAKILFATKRFDDALHVSDHLVELSPDSPGVLFNHAKIAHEDHAYTREIATLQHLIDVVSAQNQPVAGFRIYLAQAYAKDGQADPALDEFQKALDEGGLSDEQRKYVEETITTLKTRGGQ